MEKKKYAVAVPNKSFSGKRHGVQFYKGQAEGEFTEQEAKVMKDAGYEVKEVKKKK